MPRCELKRGGRAASSGSMSGGANGRSPLAMRKTFQGWRRRFGFTAGKRRGQPGGFVEIAASAGPGWDVELSLGDGVVLRLRRS